MNINVPYQSPQFNDKLLWKAQKCPFHLNREEYKHRYYLVDELYPSWVAFVKSIAHPATDKKKQFKAV